MKRILIAGILLLAQTGVAAAGACVLCEDPVQPDSVLQYSDPADGEFFQEYVGWMDSTRTFYPLISPRSYAYYESALPDSGGGDSKYLIGQVNCLVRNTRVDIISGSATVYGIPPMWYPWADTTSIGTPVDDSKAYKYSAEFNGPIYKLRIVAGAESTYIRVRFWN